MGLHSNVLQILIEVSGKRKKHTLCVSIHANIMQMLEVTLLRKPVGGTIFAVRCHDTTAEEGKT